MQRFNLMATTSYASLDMHWKGHLKHLHDDYLESRQVPGLPTLFHARGCLPTLTLLAAQNRRDESPGQCDAGQ